jgi:hypothetical protein
VSTFDAHALSILKREATAYRFITSHEAYKALAAVIPEFIDYDSDRHTLTLAYLPGHTSTHVYFFNQQHVSPVFTQRQAEILASFHFPVPATADVSGFPQSIPWILLLNENGPHYFSPTNANTDLMGIIRSNEELMRMLNETRDEWQRTALIHGDIKWTNFIVPQTAATPENIKLVDWEIADIGDPLWDVAGFLQSFLSTWLFGFDNLNISEHKLQQNMQAFDIEQIIPAASQFWSTYIRKANIPAADEHTLLMRTMRYTAARMLQTSIEGIVQTPRVYPNNVRIVQVAFNILRSPEEAARDLFGILPKALAL